MPLCGAIKANMGGSIRVNGDTQWNEVFSSAGCVVTLVDRLIHRSELISIEADSYRLKEAKERTATRKKARAKRGKTAAQTP